MRDQEAERRGLLWGIFFVVLAAAGGALAAVLKPWPSLTWVGVLAWCAGSAGGLGIPVAYQKGFIPQSPMVTREKEPVSFFVLLVGYSVVFYFLVGYGTFIVVSGF